MRAAWGLMAALTVATPALAQTLPDSQAFIKAVREADGAKATALLAAPGSTVVSARDGSSGENALHIAVRRRDGAWTSFMAGRGVDPNAVDRSGDTPLGLAARLGFTDGVRTMIAAGARVDGGNARGETPLILAVQNRRLDLVQLLIRQGANPDKTDNSAGYSARDYARQDSRNPAILRAIEAKRAPAAAARPASAKPVAAKPAPAKPQ